MASEPIRPPPRAPIVLVEHRRARLAHRIRLLVTATITYNIIEAMVAIGAGTIASSTALIGFGLDSVIEVSSAAAVAWQFAGADHKRREKPALRIIAVSFVALAGYLTVESTRALLAGERAEHSTVGLVLAGLSLLVMPVLSAGQRRTGRELGSTSAVADSKQALLCACLSAVLLVGLGLNILLGWWWADPAAALIIAAAAAKEGHSAWRGDTCCTIAAARTAVTNHSQANPDGGQPGCSCRGTKPTNIRLRRYRRVSGDATKIR